jgi:hypothetical protein
LTPEHVHLRWDYVHYVAAFLAAVAASAIFGRLLPPGRRRGFFAATGLAFALVFFPAALVAALVVLGLIVRRLGEGGPALGAGATAAAAAVIAAAVLAACFGGVLERVVEHRAAAADLMACLFAINLLKRAAYYVYERRTGRVRSLETGEFFAYLFALPFLIHGGVLASASHLEERWGPRSFREDVRAGTTTLAAAGLHALALYGLVRAAGDWLIGGGFLQRAAALHWWQLGLVFVASYIGYYCLRYSYDQACVGSARLLGWNIRDNYDWALFAVDYADYWRRWNIHSREMLMSYFYYPSLLALTRRRPESRAANVVAACFATFAGSALSDFMLRAIFFDAFAWGSYAGLVGRFAVYEGVQSALVSTTLVAEMRRRAAGRPERGPWGRAAGIGTTLLLRSAVLPLFILNDPRTGLADVLKLIARAVGVRVPS